MKFFNSLSLRLRLTMLTTTIMLLITVALTVGSINRADSYFIPDNYSVKLVSSPATAGKVDFEPNTADTTKTDNIVVSMSNIATFTATEKTDTATQNNLNISKKNETDRTNYSDNTNKADEIAISSDVSSMSYQLEAITLTTAAKKNFAYFSTGMMFIVMIAGIILTWFMAGHALKPVTTLANTVDNIDEHNLSTRITDIKTHDEIRQLADSFNHMLDKLEQAFEQQRTFAANAAHELKTPLAAIQTNLEVLELEETPSLDDYQETLDVIGRNSERLSSLVSNLLELNDQQNINFCEAISTEKVINQLLTEQTAAIAEKELKISIDNQLPNLYGNEQLLTSALRNLLENAIKYQYAGGQICLTLKNETDTVQITVWDNGPGIPEEKLSHVFEPFYRCDPSRSSKIKGSGLGLALVKTIIQRHNGTITVQSSPQDGTSFIITLPASNL